VSAIPQRTYGLREVQRLLKLPRTAVRVLINAGLISPSRGPRRQLQFTFQDLAIMRAARELLKSKIPPRRMNQSLSALRRSKPLEQANLASVGDRVVVREGSHQWQANDGQLSLDLPSAPAPDNARARGAVLHAFPARAPTVAPGRDWFELAVADEADHAELALEAYERAAAIEPTRAEAWINWGRLLHEQGNFEKAEEVYRRGLDRCPDFNLAIALEDQLRTTEAIDAYLIAIKYDESFADAHFNLARLYHARADRQCALKHLARYRKLTKR
jgi:tetratricopeptide (TPR) repeat protein